MDKMKKRLILCMLLMAALLCVCAVAFAESEPIKVSMELSSYKFTEPKTVKVTITIASTGESDMPGPVTLYYPNGNKVDGFAPTLSVGTTKTWSGDWKVTQKQLENEKVSFKYSYQTYDDEGNLQSKSKYITRRITYNVPEEEAVVEINRTITPTVAEKGQKVTITYDVVNAGNVDISSVTIRENRSISTKSQTLAKVAAGEKDSIVFKVTMGTKNLTSEPNISYKAGSKTVKSTKEAATIKYGEVSLTASLTADKKGGTKGDPAKLTLKLKNTGKSKIENITVTDATLGDVFTGESVEAGKTVTLEKDIVMDETRDYLFTVTGTDTDGLPVEASTGRVTMTVLDPAQSIELDVNASADRDTVYELPGTVRFRVSVTNNSTIDVSDVTVYAVDTRLFNFSSIPSGETKQFVRDVAVSMAGNFGFNARVKNQLDQTIRFDSNTIHIGYAQPTAAPTEAPIVTPPRPSYEPIPTDDGIPESMTMLQQVLHYAVYVIGALAALSCLLFLIGAIRRGRLRAESNAAMDHLEGGSYRDYNRPNEHPDEFDPDLYVKPDNPAPFEPEEKAAEGEPAAEAEKPAVDVMADALAKLHPEAEPDADEAEADEAPAGSGEPDADQPEEGGRHRRRGAHA